MEMIGALLICGFSGILMGLLFADELYYGFGLNGWFSFSVGLFLFLFFLSIPITGGV